MTQPTTALNWRLFKPSGSAPDERGRLDATLQRVGELVAGLQASRTDLNPRRTLSELRSDLELHFALEESNENFGALRRERPGIAHELDKLRDEHTAILDKLSDIQVLASDSRCWSDLSKPILELAETFRAHEHHEAELLQEAILRDDGSSGD
ncbi:MAG TPA: hemerythrin domain-containing protein [Polyangiaceae bacterium]